MPNNLSQNTFIKSDILLMTATNIETRAVLVAFKEFTRNEYKRKVVGPKTYYDLGDIHKTKVFMVQSEMGSVGPGGSEFTAIEAIQLLKPSFVIMVGIAFGLKPEKQSLGDILVSNQLLCYEAQRIGKDRIFRGPSPRASTLLLDRFRSAVQDWRKPSIETQIHFGLLLSGEKLVDSFDFREQLLSMAPEAIGGEMEGAGLYAAAEINLTPWIVIKAVCDWGDGNKNNPHKNQDQIIAARNATSLVVHAISIGLFDSQSDILGQASRDDASSTQDATRLNGATQRISGLEEEYKYVNEQWLVTIDQQQRLLLKRKLLALEKEIKTEKILMGKQKDE